MPLFEFSKTEIPGIVVIKANPILKDERGIYMELFNKDLFEKNGIKGEFKQDNFSTSKPGVLRGLHFQKGEHSQAKLIRCPRGRIFDVAVDMRKSSPTFGKWFGIELSEENMMMYYVPRGFANGFLVLGNEEAHKLYRIDNNFKAEAESGLKWDDPKVNVKWPAKKNLIITEKDQNLPNFDDAYKFD